MENIIQTWFDTEAALDLIDPQAVMYLVVTGLVLYVGKLVNDWLTPYKLNEQLTEVDNKAVALSFSGYILALGIILWGILSTDSSIPPTGSMSRDLIANLVDTAIWGGIGIVLLQIARLINDKILLYQFNNTKELVEDQNVGTGAVQCGTYIGSAFIIRAALSGEAAESFLVSLTSTLVFFILGQLAFILFSKLYQIVSRYDLHGEIEKDNVAAGVSFGMTLTAVGIVLSGYILRSDSIVGLALWFVLSAFLLLVLRYVVDKLLLPGKILDEEISQDRNWGAALVEGSAVLGLALILTAAF